MKKLLLLLFLLPGAIFATETRIKTLGGVPYFIEDDANVKIYPATITDYPNKIIGEITQAALNFFADLKIAILGIGINSDTIPSIVHKVIDKAPFKRFSPSPMLNLYLGKKIKGFSIGLKVSESHNYYEKEIFLHSIELQDITMSSKIALPELSIDFFMGHKKYYFENRSETSTGDTFNFYSQNKPSWETGVRFAPIFSTNVHIALGINYKKIDVSYEEQENKNNFITQSLQEYGVIRLIPNENFVVLLGVLGEQEKCDTSAVETTKKIIPKVVIGMESNLTEYFKIRIGCNKSYYTIGEEEKIIDSEFNLAIGWALNYKNFELDIMGNDLPLAKQSLSVSLSYKFSSLF